MNFSANFRMVLKPRRFHIPPKYIQSLLGTAGLLSLKGICLLLILSSCQRDATTSEEGPDTPSIPTTLPKQDFPLEDLSAFASPSEAWSIAGNAFAATTAGEFTKEEGTGALICNNETNTRTTLSTQMEHGDLEMDLKFLLPKDGQAQLWLYSP